jgi:hypothetical protein
MAAQGPDTRCGRLASAASASATAVGARAHRVTSSGGPSDLDSDVTSVTGRIVMGRIVSGRGGLGRM